MNYDDEYPQKDKVAIAIVIASTAPASLVFKLCNASLLEVDAEGEVAAVAADAADASAALADALTLLMSVEASAQTLRTP